jgi:phage tail tape-measure protein
MGVLFGGGGGAVLGAIVGSIVPGVGTAVGALVGGYAGGLAGGAASAMSDQNIFTGKDKKQSYDGPSPLPTAPTVDDATRKADDIIQRKRSAAAGSRSVYTNPLGIQNEAEVSRKMLLGE